MAITPQKIAFPNQPGMVPYNPKNVVPPPLPLPESSHGLPPSHQGGDGWTYQDAPGGMQNLGSNFKILGPPKVQTPNSSGGKPKVDPIDKLPPVLISDPPPNFKDESDTKWVWNECHQRWYTYHMELVTAVPGYIEYWLTYEPTTGEWIKITLWPMPGSPECRKDGPVIPIDDCAKYGRNCPEVISMGKVFTKFEYDDVLRMSTDVATYGMWTNNVGNLTTFYTCSAAQVSSSYGRAIFNDVCDACDSYAQFDIAYGHDGGSGSKDNGAAHDYMTPTNAAYGQYRLLCLDGNEQRFKIGDRELSHVYVINVRQDRMGDKIDEGNIEINLAHLSGSQFEAGGGSRNAHTGSNVKVSGNGQVLRLIDDSKIDFGNLSLEARQGEYREYSASRTHKYTTAGEVYNIVSGSIEDGIYNPTYPHIFGIMYPRLGVVVLDAHKLDMTASFLTVTGSDVEGDNTMKLFTAMSGAALYTDASGDILGFQARRKVVEHSEHYFVRIKNSDYNFTNNPTFVSGSEGQVLSDFRYNPTVYITSVGLYNSNYELLAVGKISTPIQKKNTSEALVEVQLRY